MSFGLGPSDPAVVSPFHPVPLLPPGTRIQPALAEPAVRSAAQPALPVPSAEPSTVTGPKPTNALGRWLAARLAMAWHMHIGSLLIAGELTL
jgi:hypothetical protein